MTSTSQRPPQDFVLTPQQQRLLFAALNANKPSGSPANNFQTNSLSPLDDSPFQESPLIDYDYDFGDPNSSLDFSFDDGDQPKMIGDLPPGPSTAKSDSADAESPDKRSHPDDDDEEENGAKRRESEDKVAKKPGRKPLTTEPSSVSFEPVPQTCSRGAFCLLTSLVRVTEAKGTKSRRPACFP